LGSGYGKAVSGALCLTERVRIEQENGEPVGEVWAVLTADEAHLLMASLAFYFEECFGEPGWHHHVDMTAG
jgi:hypothetical protein